KIRIQGNVIKTTVAGGAPFINVAATPNNIDIVDNVLIDAGQYQGASAMIQVKPAVSGSIAGGNVNIWGNEFVVTTNCKFPTCILLNENYSNTDQGLYFATVRNNTLSLVGSGRIYHADFTAADNLYRDNVIVRLCDNADSNSNYGMVQTCEDNRVAGAYYNSGENYKSIYGNTIRNTDPTSITTVNVWDHRMVEVTYAKTITQFRANGRFTVRNGLASGNVILDHDTSRIQCTGDTDITLTPGQMVDLMPTDRTGKVVKQVSSVY
ncbi:MAG: hypothetical protein PHT33_15965, partial [bacterium]|nr:hypothetical protein [bacterium]